MISIKPIMDSDASEDVLLIYSEIASILGVKSVPLPFRFLANNPQFLKFSWERIKEFILNPDFEKETAQLGDFSDSVINIISSPSPALLEFVSSANETEVEELRKNTEELLKLNSKLTIIFIALRESLKGVVNDHNLNLPAGEKRENIYQDQSSIGYVNNSDLAQGEILPVLENNSLILVRFPDFYTLISQEIQGLIKTEKYLKSRVEVEKLSQDIIEGFGIKMKFPFDETVTLLRGKEFSEEIYIMIKALFPTQFPHNLLTSSLMKNSLNKSSEVSVV